MTEHHGTDMSHDDSLVESHELNTSNVSCLTHTVHALVTNHKEEHGGGQELHHDFNMVILLTFSFASIWCAGKAASKLGLPTLVGEILVGVVLGPPLANLMPVPEALMLFGEVGLMLLVLEAGLDVDFDMLKLIGLRGIAIAITGSLTPLALGALLSSSFMGLEWKAALAVGCTLAPTSMGIALNVLKQAKMLDTPTGQLIIAAAVLDDVIALLLLSELQARSHSM